MPYAARLNDFHSCPMLNPDGSPHVGGGIQGPGVSTVNIGGMPAAVVGDAAMCTGPPDTILQGSATVNIGGKPAARAGDPTAHGGTIAIGCMTVNIN